MPPWSRRRSRAVERRDPLAATRTTTTNSVGMESLEDLSDELKVRKLWLANTYVDAAIRAISHDLARLKFRAGPDPDTPQDYNPTAPLAMLLGPPPGGPNPVTSPSRLWRWTAAQYVALGRFAWEVELQGAEPVGLWPLVARHLTPVRAKNGSQWFTGYKYAGENGQDVKLTPEQVVYCWNPHPDDYRQSYSPLDAARLDVEVMVAQDRYDAAFIKNDAKPATIVVHEEIADDDERDRFRRQWNSRHQGPDNAGRTAFVETTLGSNLSPKDALNVVTVGMSQRESQALERYSVKLRSVCVALGVPLGRLGDIEGRTYANADREMVTYWQNTVLPLASDLADAVNMQLAPRVGGGSDVGWWDLDDVEELRPAPLLAVPTLKEAVEVGLLSTAEGREELGYDPGTAPEAVAVPATAAPADTPQPAADAPQAAPAGDQQPGTATAPIAEQRATWTPPQGVQETAQRAVRWIEDGLAGDGFTAVGRRRASQLAAGDPVSLDTLKRMNSYFARHAVDAEATGWNADEPGFPTPGRVAWDSWGGDPGRAWAGKIVAAETDDRASAPASHEERRRRAWAATDAKVSAYEQTFERRFQRLLDAQRRAVLDRLTGNRGRQAVKGEVRADAVYDPGFWRSRIAAEMEAEFAAIVAGAGGDLAGALGLSFDLSAPHVDAFIKARANQLAGPVTDTTYRAIQDALIEGVKAGEGIKQLAARIEHLFDVTWARRAETVARTEVISAYNGGSVTTALGYGPDVVAGMEWISTADKRTREAHRDADGQTIRAGDVFRVGGESLAYPGDPNGSGENVINCRCTVGHLTPDDLADRGLTPTPVTQYAGPALEWRSVEDLCVAAAQGRITWDDVLAEVQA